MSKKAFVSVALFLLPLVAAADEVQINGLWYNNEDVFSNRANATLYVPKGSKGYYQEASVWKDFKQIMELEQGDANGDGKVTIADVKPSPLMTSSAS